MERSTSLGRIFKREIDFQISNQQSTTKNLLPENIKSLPECIQRYMAFIGCIQKPMINYIHIIYGKTTHIQKPNARPTILSVCEQYNFGEVPFRSFFMRGKMKGLSFEGKENYCQGSGNMRIKLMGLVTVVNLKGKEINETALVTYLAECALLPSGFLNRNIQWQEIDPYTVRATISDKNIVVSGIFYFSETGALIKFVSNDRYYIENDNHYIKKQWIAEVGNYKLMQCGLKFPSYLKASWKLSEGDFLYFNGEIIDIETN